MMATAMLAVLFSIWLRGPMGVRRTSAETHTHALGMAAVHTHLLHTWGTHGCRNVFLTAGLQHPAVQPFGASLLCALPQFQGEYANRMLWGTYRPGLYLGECGVTFFMVIGRLCTTTFLWYPLAHIVMHSACAGMRMRHPRSLLAGMMWFDPDKPDPLGSIRHLAQERDGACMQCAMALMVACSARLSS